MPSEAAKKRKAKKKESGKRRPSKQVTNNDEGDMSNAVNGVADKVEDLKLSARSCTGVLASHAQSMDLHIHNFSCTFHGQILFEDTNLELNSGNRYGLMGANGCGKSTMLACLGHREVPIPEHIDIFYLDKEMPASDITPLEAVMDVDDERVKLEQEAERLMHEDPESHHLLDIYERLDELDVATAEMRAARILIGLGFTAQMQKKKLSDFSGGWRMRVSLARALFVKPYLLLLDEPTNHLDLDACVWLEEELKSFKHILVLISHSQDFLNGVCTNMITMNQRKLQYYSGNYDAYVRTRMELDENQMKRYKWEQEQISHMKDYIARFGHGSAKLAKQAQSKEKTLAKMVEKGLTEKVSSIKQLEFYFPDCNPLAPPVLMIQNVSFRYNNETPWIYKDLEFGIDLDTRLALVGPNGAGKSTLLKLIAGEHLADHLDMDLSPLQYMMKCYPDVKEIEQMRKIIGRYGLTGKQQICPIKNLSDGQKCRVVFAWLSRQNPHLLLLDEPTNHLDIETIDSLAIAINEFNGGMILVSHDFRLISQVAKDIWVCEGGTVTPWKGGILGYKDHLKKKVIKQEKNLAKGKSADHHAESTSMKKVPSKNKLVEKPKKKEVIQIVKPKKIANTSNGDHVNGDSRSSNEVPDYWDA